MIPSKESVQSKLTTRFFKRGSALPEVNQEFLSPFLTNQLTIYKSFLDIPSSGTPANPIPVILRR